MASFKKTGNYNEIVSFMNNLKKNIKKTMDSNLRIVAYKIQKTMVTGIRDKRFNFAPNAPSTIKAKKSSTPLINFGELLGSIKVRKVQKGYLIGAYKNARHSNGGSLANIFAILTFGINTISKSGKIMKMPARDAISPSVLANEKEFKKHVELAIKEAIK